MACTIGTSACAENADDTRKPTTLPCRRATITGMAAIARVNQSRENSTDKAPPRSGRFFLWRSRMPVTSASEASPISVSFNAMEFPLRQQRDQRAHVWLLLQPVNPVHGALGAFGPDHRPGIGQKLARDLLVAHRIVGGAARVRDMDLVAAVAQGNGGMGLVLPQRRIGDRFHLVAQCCNPRLGRLGVGELRYAGGVVGEGDRCRMSYDEFRLQSRRRSAHAGTGKGE